ncbi:MAG TPA: nucleotidyltransferase family protein [Tissierellia bacterium]|nr:nucleotidyltransferase family protein [Tissierellia bacterium]
MKTLAIIAEYNPLHEGHRYHLEQSLRQGGASHSLILMSGNFVQRGEPAIEDKFSRAEQAIRMGADLVLELPYIYAQNSAEYFAEGAIRILNDSGVVDVLSFGSETADLDALKHSAKRLLEPDHAAEIKQLMSQGLSYARAVETRLGGASRRPNDILAIQYLRALIKHDSPIEPLQITRLGDYHDESLRPAYPSASAIRRAHRDGRLSRISQPIFWEDLSDMIFSRLITAELSDIHGMQEGIEHALKFAALNRHSLSELIEATRTPRFGLARLKRLLGHTLMGYTKKDQAELQQVVYFRPLAFNDRGRELLKQIKRQNPENFIPTLARYRGDPKIMRALRFDIISSNLYYHLQQSRPEQTRRPTYIT